MSLMDDVGSAVASLVGGSTGWTLAKGSMPPTPDKILAIFEAAGNTPEVDPSAPTQYDYPSFQIRVRGAMGGYSEAHDKLNAAFLLLHNGSVTNCVYVFAIHSPLLIGTDELGRPEIVVNFQAMRARG